MVKLSSFSIVLFFFFTNCFAQSTAPATVNQSIEWLAVSSTMKVHKKVGFFVEGQFRFAQGLESMQHQFRTALELYPSKKFAFVPLGYAYTWNYKYGKQPASIVNNEHRIYQQIVYKNSLSRLFMQHRLRMEERFLQNHSITPEGTVEGNDYSDVRYRLRYRALVNIPINNAKIDAKTLYVSVWDEVFVSWGKRVTYHSPDQNRLFVGVGYQFTKLISLQGGPFYQMIKKSNGTKQENNIGGMVQFTCNLDFTKAEH